MKLSAMCLRCLIDRQEERVREEADEEKKSAYMKAVAGVIASSAEEASAPYLVYEINKIHAEYYGASRDYAEEKKEYNGLMLSMEPELESWIRSAEEPEGVLKNALRIARAANYIDFGAMNHVDKKELMSLLDRAGEEELSGQTFRRFRMDMESAERLVLLTDNCGEIVADKLLVTILKERYPQLDITVIVRGMPVLNDASMQDAQEVGLTGIVKVMGNGNGVAGTQIELLSVEARRLLLDADVVIAKGQGNFETLYGCGRNVYYLFLCKCAWFSKRFGQERLRGVFVNEAQLQSSCHF